MKIRQYLCELVMPLTFSWLFMTFLVDFVAIPAVFRNSTQVADAAKIGMKVFFAFNKFEVFFGVLIMSGVLLSIKVKFRRFILFFGFFLLSLSLFYLFYLTPTIIDLNLKMHTLDKLSGEFAVLQAKHQTFHGQYRTLDSIKILSLIFLSALLLSNRVETNREIV